MDQEEAIKGIRKINISLAEREFKAKPVYAYDVFISAKEYTEMLANEKKSLRNWALQIWHYILFFCKTFLQISWYCIKHYFCNVVFFIYNQ